VQCDNNLPMGWVTCKLGEKKKLLVLGLLLNPPRHPQPIFKESRRKEQEEAYQGRSCKELFGHTSEVSLTRRPSEAHGRNEVVQPNLGQRSTGSRGTNRKKKKGVRENYLRNSNVLTKGRGQTSIGNHLLRRGARKSLRTGGAGVRRHW